jgi:glycosyltransferase involved in cell wall biosynthesis
MNNTAIIMGTYNRAHLLKRSLALYPDDVDIYILDDGSTDNTFDLCKQSSKAFGGSKNIKYYFLEGKQPGVWRDSASFLNRGIKYALQKGYKYIFITHPEIIPGINTIEAAKALAVDKETWISCKGYYLTPEQQARLDTVAWLTNLLNVRQLPNFYQSIAEFRGNADYMPQAIERCKVWGSWIFGGGTAEMWKYFGGVTPFDVWGSIDVDLLNRRHVAGMKTVTPVEESAIVVHQNHDDATINIPTPRDMEKCMAVLPRYTSKEQALKPQLLL